METECPRCDGTGLLDNSGPGYRAYGPSEMACDYCKGTGLQEEELPEVVPLWTCLEWKKDFWYRWYTNELTGEKLAFVLLDPQPKAPNL